VSRGPDVRKDAAGVGDGCGAEETREEAGEVRGQLVQGIRGE